ncbi:YihY/virulence factor BrkB family protein [Intrasporangium sp. DVR]|uniref:YihY/virulence factor BrkB family protein n=1 Tax=Intrasporangium sp. DVR TaxID=3127867 RepID=UPI00313A50CD
MTVKSAVRRILERVPGAVPLARVTLETVRVSLNYRVTGLAAEGAFFLLLSLPPFVLGLFGGVGYLGNILGPDSVQRLLDVVTDYASGFLTQSSIDELLLPTVRDVLRDGRPDLISVGFLIALWSGSRALNVFVDTIAIMYGQGDGRGILRQRFLTFGLYTLGIVVAVVLLPLVLLGPAIIEAWLPERVKFLTIAYWPLVLVLSIALLTTLFHIATPRRARWWRNAPGALLALGIWLLASLVVRSALEASLGGSSIYGPLSTPIVLLIWLYVLAIAILIGAGLNAATRVLWPVELRDGAGTRLAHWAGRRLSRGDLARPVVKVDPAVGDQRSRDQQFTKRERPHLAEALDRELEEGVARPRRDGTTGA